MRPSSDATLVRRRCRLQPRHRLTAPRLHSHCPEIIALIVIVCLGFCLVLLLIVFCAVIKTEKLRSVLQRCRRNRDGAANSPNNDAAEGHEEELMLNKNDSRVGGETSGGTLSEDDGQATQVSDTLNSLTMPTESESEQPAPLQSEPAEHHGSEAAAVLHRDPSATEDSNGGHEPATNVTPVQENDNADAVAGDQESTVNSSDPAVGPATGQEFDLHEDAYPSMITQADDEPGVEDEIG